MSAGTTGARSFVTFAWRGVGSKPSAKLPLRTRATSSLSNSPVTMLPSSEMKRAIRMGAAAYARGWRMSFLLPAGRRDRQLEPPLRAVALGRLHGRAVQPVQVAVRLHLDDLDVLRGQREAGVV